MPDRAGGFQLLADPWWVNLAILVPVVCAWRWRRHRLAIGWARLAALAAWAVAFGFVEAAVVVYLRGVYVAQSGLAPTRIEIGRLSDQLMQPLVVLPADLVAIEMWREAATIVMLVGVACLSARAWRERVASLLWVFAVWDLAYYAGLWLAVGWPASPLTPDVLFLIPRPWFSQVWFPILVSALTLLAIAISRRRTGGAPGEGSAVTASIGSSRHRRRSTVP